MDLVHDSGEHFGPLRQVPLFFKLDSIENILANKLTAIMGRDEVKDVVDIWAIAKHDPVSWKEIFIASNSKAVGIFPPSVAEKLVAFPVAMLDQIKWIEGVRPSDKQFMSDLDSLIESMLSCD